MYVVLITNTQNAALKVLIQQTLYTCFPQAFASSKHTSSSTELSEAQLISQILS